MRRVATLAEADEDTLHDCQRLSLFLSGLGAAESFFWDDIYLWDEDELAAAACCRDAAVIEVGASQNSTNCGTTTVR